jgi:hypothetical protein
MEPKVSCESIGSREYDVRVVQRVRQTQSEYGSQHRNHGDGSRFYFASRYSEGQLEEEKIQEIVRNIKEEKSPKFMEDDQDVLWYKGRINVPSVKELKDKILHEARKSASSIHLGRNKMYHNPKVTYWWYRVKRQVVEYITLCDTCQRVKVEHQ